MYKLVRDNIPALAKASGSPVKFAKVTDPVFLNELLLAKLSEETNEFITAYTEEIKEGDADGFAAKNMKSLEELADVFTVMTAFIKELGFTSDDFFAVYKKKLAERGGFTEGVILLKD